MPLFSDSNGAKCMSAKWLRPVGDRVTHPISLHSKRFRASSSRKLGQEQKKRNEGGGGREWRWKIRIKGRKTLGDKSQRQIASCLQWTFCEIICLATRHKFQLIRLCKLWRRQNPVEDFSAQKFSRSSQVICCCDLPLRPVASILHQLATTCRPIRTKKVIYYRDVVQRHVAWCVPTLKETISHKHRHKKKKEVPGEGTFQPSQTMIVKLKHVHAKISTYAIWRPQVLLNPPHGMSVWLGLVLINPSLHHHPQFPYQQKPYFLVAF